VSVALVIQYAMRVSNIVTCGLVGRTIHFPRYLTNSKIFEKNYWTSNAFFVCLHSFVWNISYSSSMQRNIII